jgi:hypothetical protein
MTARNVATRLWDMMTAFHWDHKISTKGKGKPLKQWKESESLGFWTSAIVRNSKY